MKTKPPFSRLLAMAGLAIFFTPLSLLGQTGPNYSSSAVGDASTAFTFTNPGNAAGSGEGDYATVTLDDNEYSEYLMFTGFGFSITDGHAIDGVQVEIKGFSDHTWRIDYTSIYLIRGGTIQTGGNNHGSTNESIGTVDQVKTYGNGIDLWGITLTEAQVEDTNNFGVAFEVGKATTLGGAYTAQIDWVRITVFHSPAPASTFTATGNGDWNDGATWGNTSPGVEGTDYPGSSDRANIPGGTTITIPTATISRCQSLVLNSDLSTSTAATLNLTDANSALVVSGSTTLACSFAQTSNATNTINLNGGSIAVNGDVFLESDWIFTGTVIWGATINIDGGAMTVAGDIYLTSDNAAANALIDLSDAGSSLEISSGSFVESGTAGTGQLLTLGTDCTVTYSGTSSEIEGTIGGTALTYDNLTLNGSGAKTMAENFTINGNLNLGGTATFSDGGNTLTYGTSSSIEYAGSSAQTTGDELLATVETININNANDVNLNSDVTVNDGITFTSGNIVLGSNDIIMNTGTSTGFTGHGTSSYVVTSGTGYLEQNTSDFNVFPVGTSSYYDPVVLIPTSATEFQVRVSSGTPTSALVPASVVSAEWQIDLSGSAPGDTFVQLEWDQTQEGGDFQSNDANVFVGRYTGSEWQETAATYNEDNPSAGRSRASASGFTSFSPFGVGAGAGSLPVTLVEFNAAMVNNRVDINWTTSSETNNDYFTVERSSNGSSWISIGMVDGAGNSNESLNYSLIDWNPTSGLSYYRLVQTDFDGKFEIFEPIEVNGLENRSLSVYPNPWFQDTPFNLNVGRTEVQELVVTLIDLNGRVLYQDQFHQIKTTLALNLPTLDPGVYILRTSMDHLVQTRRIFVR